MYMSECFICGGLEATLLETELKLGLLLHFVEVWVYIYCGNIVS
jgi:hypothetical protein